MELKVCRGSDNLITSWSGGTTTQIAIYPETCEYGNRDFIWRISSAMIELEESDFTSLPGYDRILLVLEGEVILSHEAERVSRLSQYQQDRFDGAGSTKSFGKIRDFNLMYRKGGDATLTIFDLSTEVRSLKEPNHLSDQYDLECQFFFCIGEFSVVIVNGTEYLLKMGDALVVKREMQEPIEAGAMGNGKIITGIIQFNEQEIELNNEQKWEEMPERPREKASFDDLKMAAYLALTNYRGSQYIFKGRRENWQDKELQKAIGKIENFLLPFCIGIAGTLGVALWSEQVFGVEATMPAVGLWLIFDIFILNPLLYFMVLPKPIRGHLKKITDLTDGERKLYEEEKNTNKQAERILKKYAITGRNKYTD